MFAKQTTNQLSSLRKCVQVSQLVCAFKKKKALSTEYCETSRMFVGSSSDNVGVRSLVKGVLGPEESWMVVQAKRRRDREDVYKKNPGLDPVFMKI